MTANQLHLSKLEAFTEFLDKEQVPWRNTSAAYQVIQVYVGGNWIPVYKRQGAKEHFSTELRLDHLVKAFLHKPYKAELVENTDSEDF